MKKEKMSRLKKLTIDTGVHDEITRYGDYRMGLTYDEVKNYLKYRALKKFGEKFSLKKMSKIYRTFKKLLNGSTMVLTISGVPLIYRCDVKSISDYIFEGKEYIFD